MTGVQTCALPIYTITQHDIDLLSKYQLTQVRKMVYLQLDRFCQYFRYKIHYNHEKDELILYSSNEVVVYIQSPDKSYQYQNKSPISPPNLPLGGGFHHSCARVSTLSEVPHEILQLRDDMRTELQKLKEQMKDDHL